MNLGNLLKSVNTEQKKIIVEGICCDSRLAKKNDIFFAITGNKTSGVKFINEAISKNVSGIVIEKKINYRNSKIPIIKVQDVRKHLSEACANYYKTKVAKIIAVTGTNGKSSVLNFFYQILNINKKSVASIGTLGIFSKNYNKKTKLTTIDPISLHKHLNILIKKKIKNIIVEASSHGLKQKRLDFLNIKVGIFTNLSHDHLDYHKNMKSYFNSKMYLFNTLLKRDCKIVTDEENKEFKILKQIAKKKKIKKSTIGTYTGNIRILKNKYRKDIQIVKVLYKSKIFILEIPLIGFFQIKNLFMATLAASFCGIKINKILKQLHRIKSVPGRLECIGNLKDNSKIIIDFAHTPEALEASLKSIKKQFQSKIILVFGCGGDRDKKKRAMMGRIANKYCKKVFVTDDNPRGENPKKIRDEIISRCKKVSVDIGDRKKAIENAIKELKPNDVVLVAGKGHEETQDYGSKIIKFSDKKIINKIINKNSFKRSLNKETKNINNFQNLNYNNVCINSKEVKKNDLFFAIKGANKDGHDFAKEAIKKGALKVVLNKKVKSIPDNKIIKVNNTFSSLNNLAKFTRHSSNSKIVAITGSVGKTTLKNLIGHSLKKYGKVYQSPLSYNNKFGVPLSMSNLKADIRYGIFEIGMDKKGEIDNLSKIVKPEIAIITNISEAHLKNFNHLRGIAKAKAEIINNILENGTIILNKDSKFYNFFLKKAQKKKIKVITFSTKKRADIFLIGLHKHKNFYKIKVNVNKQFFFFEIKHPTESIIKNVLACISVLFILNLNLKNSKIFSNFSVPEGRGDLKKIKKFKKIFSFIDESYNANPLSMASAIKNINFFKKKKKSRKIVFLGDMLELGKQSRNLHKKLAFLINKSDIDKVFIYGKNIKETFNNILQNKKGKIFTSLNEAYVYFSKNINNNDLLMIKGSNATGLNQFSKNIKKGKISVI